MIGTAHTADKIGEVVRGQSCARGVVEVILHHTWQPTAEQYRGRATVDGIWRFHTAERGWRDIGYHYLVGPDGTVWLGRPLGERGAHVEDRNNATVGVALILDGDKEKPSAAQAAACGALLKALCERFGIDPAQNFAPTRGFHRDYSEKSCPGDGISKAQVLGWIKSAGSPSDAELEARRAVYAEQMHKPLKALYAALPAALPGEAGKEALAALNRFNEELREAGCKA